MLGRVLVGYRPAGGGGTLAHGHAVGQPIQLDYGSVDIVGQGISLVTQRADVVENDLVIGGAKPFL